MLTGFAARRTKTYGAGTLVSATGIKTSFATSTSASLLTVADFNGTGHTAGVLDLPRTITITLSNTAGAFNATDAILVAGWRGGFAVVESFLPATTAGNATLHGAQAFDTVISIAIPAQGSTGGAFTIGVEHICAPKGDLFQRVKLHADGNLVVQYGEGTGAPTDSIPVIIANQQTEAVAPSRILTGSGQTSVGITLYMT